MTPQEFLVREAEVREAHSIFPELELGAAYRKYKEAKNETATMLNSNDPNLKRIKAIILHTFRRHCTQPNCSGTQILEGVCEGCVEGKVGYKTKWTCEVCLHRELSKLTFPEWHTEMTKE